MAQYRVTVDTGGTFSDFIFLNSETGEVSLTKIPSTPDDPSRAIVEGVKHLIRRGVEPHDISYFCHGTTVGTNALLEGKGARTGLVVTKGFRGIYEVGEQSRPHGAAIFDIFYDRPLMLIPASRTIEAAERVASDGTILLPLDETALRKDLQNLSKKGVDSIAVCLLFSFLEPSHENRVREIILEELPYCSISLSCEVAPQIREYHRLSTTAVNAYLQPLLARYINRLDAQLLELGVTTPQKYIMQSNGGMSTFVATARKAVATVLSGPAGGINASVQASHISGKPNLVTFDMGGTSCDVALILEGTATVTNQGKVEGRDLALPMVDINTVSAGGGTIALVDRFGELVVGPQSAGAVPGPVCYGRGGTQPTITDCNLVLGYLSPENFLGGGMTLDVAAARSAISSQIAEPLGISIEEAAEGIVRIIDVKMQEAIKAISTMRGHDLRNFMLLAYGGAGPLHAARIARDLDMAGVVIPLHPGVYSALGLVMSDVRHDYVRSRMASMDQLDEPAIMANFTPLAEAARRDLAQEGFAPDRTEIAHALDMRYAGQGYEITLPCPDRLHRGDLDRLRTAFHQAHRKAFGHAAPGEPVEIVSYRVQGIGRVDPVRSPTFTPADVPVETAIRQMRSASFGGRALECPVFQREQLGAGHEFHGPAIVDQFDCTTVIPLGCSVRLDSHRNMIITFGAA